MEVDFAVEAALLSAENRILRTALRRILEWKIYRSGEQFGTLSPNEERERLKGIARAALKEIQ